MINIKEQYVNQSHRTISRYFCYVLLHNNGGNCTALMEMFSLIVVVGWKKIGLCNLIFKAFYASFN